MKKIKAIRPVWVGDRQFMPGDIVDGLIGKALERALADDKVIIVRRKKVVKHADG